MYKYVEEGALLKNSSPYLRICKAVNREDKRSRRYRDRDLAKFERSRRYRHRYRCCLAGLETGIWFSETQPRREREPDR